MACPVWILSCIRYCRHAAAYLSESPARHNVCYRILFLATSGSKIQNFFPHRNQVTHIDLLSCILLGCLNFQNLICPGKMSEKRMDRFPYLKINRTILDLKDHIICKHSVQRSKIVISRFCSVCLLVSPVLLAVVYKAPPDNSSSIRLYGFCQHIGPI